MKFIFFLLISLLSCTSSTNHSIEKKYMIMNTLWSRNVLKSELTKNFGDDYKEIEDGIIYNIGNSQLVESGHFFNSSQQLVEQFIIVNDLSLIDLKQSVLCDWVEREDKKSIGHTIHTFESGTCVEKNISYEYRPDLRLYEVRWKKH